MHSGKTLHGPGSQVVLFLLLLLFLLANRTNDIICIILRSSLVVPVLEVQVRFGTFSSNNGRHNVTLLVQGRQSAMLFATFEQDQRRELLSKAVMCDRKIIEMTNTSIHTKQEQTIQDLETIRRQIDVKFFCQRRV